MTMLLVLMTICINIGINVCMIMGVVMCTVMFMVVLMSMRVKDFRIINKQYAKHEQDY